MDGRVIVATGIVEVLAALEAVGVPDDGTWDDLIGSARTEGDGYFGIYRVVYEDMTYRLELGPDDEGMGWVGPDVSRWANRWGSYIPPQAYLPSGLTDDEIADMLREAGLAEDVVAFHMSR